MFLTYSSFEWALNCGGKTSNDNDQSQLPGTVFNYILFWGLHQMFLGVKIGV